MSKIINKIGKLFRLNGPSLHNFSRYKVRETGFSEEQFWQTYVQMKPYISNSRILDGIDDYRRLIDGLLNITNVKLVPLKELMLQNEISKKIVSLRFDVDMEPLAAIQLARHNARCGIPSSFFLLHTAYYYGIMEDKVFYRNPLLKKWVKALIISGCEICLHTDALHLYLNHDVDGAMSVVEEIAWLRSQGAHISGTAAHNSYPAYHAENFEIFSNYVLWGRSEAVFDSKRFPLGILDESILELTYEANYPIVSQKTKDKRTKEKIVKWCNTTNAESVESETWMRTYLQDNPCFERDYDVSVWHHGGNKWTVAIKKDISANLHWYWQVDRIHMFDVLVNLPDGVRIVFLLHPIYFSRDTHK